MDVVRNGHPSLPPNYTSLVQLRERWELEQKQKNNPERPRHQERERAEGDPEQRERGQRGQNLPNQTNTRDIATSHPQNQRYQQKNNPERQGHQERERVEGDPEQRERGQRGQNLPNQTRTRDIATSHPQNQRYQHHPKPDIPQFEAAVLDDVAQKQQQQQRVKKKWKKKFKKNTTLSKSNRDEQKANNNERNAEKEGTGATAVVKPEETAVVRGNESDKLREIEGSRRNFRVNGVDQGGNGRVEKQKNSSEAKASSIVQDILAVSVNGRKEGNGRPWKGRNRCYVDGRRDGNYVWVKKGEGTDAVVNGVQRSGTFNMDRARQGGSSQRSWKQKESF